MTSRRAFVTAAVRGVAFALVTALFSMASSPSSRFSRWAKSRMSFLFMVLPPLCAKFSLHG